MTDGPRGATPGPANARSMPVRTLYLVRHAKSAWDDPTLSDFDRPLNARGLRDAPEMARRFAARKEPVDLLVSSPAARAISTAQVFASALEQPEVQQEPALYLATPSALMGLIASLPDTASSAMLFGHNPGLSELAELLCNNGIGNLPTCTIVRIDLEAAHWAEVASGTGILKWWDTPKGGLLAG